MARRKIIPYNPKLKAMARKLRNNSTLSEILLWKYLKGKQMMGYDFDRQKPLDEYIVDFFSYELMLAIEIDGHSHDGRFEQDERRQRRLESFGIRFLRFDDRALKQDMNSVLHTIEGWIEMEEERRRMSS